MNSIAPVACFVILMILNLLSTRTHSVDCLRFQKDIVRPRLKCQRNFTSEHQTLSYHRRCIALNNPYCLDIKLPYNSTFLPDYLPDLNIRSFEDVRDYLQRWTAVRKLPKCWPILQVALCSILMPQCDEYPQTGQVTRIFQPNVDICNDLVNKDECRFIEKNFGWPAIFNCSDTSIYAKNCTNELRDFKFSSSPAQSACLYPLVATNEPTTWIKNISGCALHCKFPISSDQVQSNISLFKYILSLAGLGGSSIALILIHVNQTNSKTSRLTQEIKRCIIYLLIFYTGWSLSLFYRLFVSSSSIGCSSNNSALYDQPLVASSCILSFLLIYMPSLWILLSYAYLGILIYEKIEGLSQNVKTPTSNGLSGASSLFFHGLPLMLFVCIIFIGQIDGHGLYGICTVGQQSLLLRGVFIFLPRILIAIYGGNYFIKSIIKLKFFKKPMEARLRRNFNRIKALFLLISMQAIFPILFAGYEYIYKDRWQESIENYVSCNLNLQYDLFTGPASDSLNQPDCHIDIKPTIAVYYIELLFELSPGFIIASWSFSESNFRGFRRMIIDRLEDERDKQRRFYSYLRETYCDEIVQDIVKWLVNNEIAEVVEPRHYLIDMTVSDADRKGPIELKQIENNPRQGWQESGRQSLIGTPMSRRPSLRSTDLTSMINQSSIQIYHTVSRSMHHNSGKNPKFVHGHEKTAKNVVEEIRLSEQLIPTEHNAGIEQPPITQTDLSHYFLPILSDMAEKAKLYAKEKHSEPYSIEFGLYDTDKR